MELLNDLEKELEQKPDFSFLDDGKYGNLGSCFDFVYEKLEPGESRGTDGRIGILMQGRGHYDFHGVPMPASKFDVFGMEYNEWGNSAEAPCTFTADTAVTLIWADYRVCTSVCYASCWYHGMLIREIKEAYGRQHDMKVFYI